MEEKILKLLINDAVIDYKEVEIYRYGLHLFIKRIFHSMIILLVGYISGEFWNVLFFLIAYASIREYSGGYHAKTTLGCYMCTIVLTIASILLLAVLQQIGVMWSYIGMVICGAFIWILSPQEAINKPLEALEKLHYCKMTRKYLVVLGAISLLGFWFSSVLYGIACAFVSQSIMLWIGTWRLRSVN